MGVARQSRGYDPRWLWQARAVASSAGTLFVRSFERGERVHLAMVSRGYAGAMPGPRRCSWRRHGAGRSPCRRLLGASVVALVAWVVR